MKIKEFFSNLINKRSFRWYILAGVSFASSLAFATYNFVIGVLYGLVWNFSVSIYYILLTVVKAVILYDENKWKDLPQKQLKDNRLKLFKVENVYLLTIDLAFIAPMFLLLTQRAVGRDMGMIPTIALATYATYKIVTACLNYSRSKKTDNLALHGLKVISLKEAIVSIITLQNTMIVTFGDVSKTTVFITCTSIGIFALSVIVSIFQFVKLRKLKKRPK